MWPLKPKTRPPVHLPFFLSLPLTRSLAFTTERRPKKKVLVKCEHRGLPLTEQSLGALNRAGFDRQETDDNPLSTNLGNMLKIYILTATSNKNNVQASLYFFGLKSFAWSFPASKGRHT